jgi:HSP20 family protein
MLYRSTLAPAFGLRREIDRLFDDMLGMQAMQNRSAWTPAVDIREDEKELTIVAELPGLKPEQVEVTCDNGVLSIRGEKTETRKEGEEGRWHLAERSYGSFNRSFQLPQGVDESKIDGSFDNGLLTVRIPKAALPQPKRINISVTGSQESGMRRLSEEHAKEGG